MDFKHLVVPNSYNRFNLYQFEVKLGSRSKSQDTSSHWTFCDSMLASAFHSCLPPSMFGHFLYPNSKRHIPSQKWILKQQVRVPLNIPKHSTKISCQCTSPFRHLVRATPKTTRKPFRGHGRCCQPRPPWPPQRSAARPRRRGLREPRNAAPSGLGRRGCDAEGGDSCGCHRETKRSNGMFLRVVGKNSEYRS